MTLTLILGDSEHHRGLSIRVGTCGGQVQPTWVYCLTQIICLAPTFIIRVSMLGSGQNTLVPWSIA